MIHSAHFPLRSRLVGLSDGAWRLELPADCEDRMAELELAVRSLGVHTERFSAPLEVALKAVEGDRILLTLDAREKPVLLTGMLGDRVRLEHEEGAAEWVDADALMDRLGLYAGWEHEWLAPEQDVLSTKKDASPWRKALDLIRRDSRDVAVIAIYAAGVGVLSLALPIAVQVLVNTVAFGTVLQPIVVLSLLLGAGLIFAATLRALQMWVVEIVQRRVFVRLVSALSHRLPRVHVRAFERAHGPELVNRFFDVFTAQKAVASLLLGGIEAALTVLVGLVVLAFYHPVLLGLGILILLGVSLVVFILGRGAAGSAIHESKQKFGVAGWLEEMARHLFALKVAGSEAFARARLDALASDWLDARQSHFRVVFRQVLATLGLQVVTSVALLGIGGWLVIERELTIGQLVAAELIVTAVVAALNKLGGKLESAYDLVAAADKLGVLLSLPVERSGGQPFRCEGGASVVFENVTSEDGLISGLNIDLPAGRRLVITGSAERREALTELLFGMREPGEGIVFIDGHDTRDVELTTLRSRVAVVRHPETLPGSIADNLRAAAPKLSSAELWTLLAQVGLRETIRRLPDGLRTEILPSGSPLTRNAALRLTLARALATQPALLVLDGVLEQLHLDPTALESMLADRTVIVLGNADVPGARIIELPEAHR